MMRATFALSACLLAAAAAQTQPSLTPAQLAAANAAKAEMKLGPLSDGAVAALRDAHALSPTHPALAQLLGVGLLRRGEREAAIPLLRAALGLAPSAPGMAGARASLVDALLADDSPAAAAEASALGRAEASPPLGADAHQRISLRRRGDNATDDARYHAERAVEIAPAAPASHLALGLALADGAPPTSMKKRERRSAVDALRKALELSDAAVSSADAAHVPLPPAWRAEALHYIGTLLATSKKPKDPEVDEAMECFAEATSLAPGVAKYAEAAAALEVGKAEKITRRKFETEVERELTRFGGAAKLAPGDSQVNPEFDAAAAGARAAMGLGESSGEGITRL